MTSARGNASQLNYFNIPDASSASESSSKRNGKRKNWSEEDSLLLINAFAEVNKKKSSI